MLVSYFNHKGTAMERFLLFKEILQYHCNDKDITPCGDINI